jgi:hypothetical protein
MELMFEVACESNTASFYDNSEKDWVIVCRKNELNSFDFSMNYPQWAKEYLIIKALKNNYDVSFGENINN